MGFALKNNIFQDIGLEYPAASLFFNGVSSEKSAPWVVSSCTAKTQLIPYIVDSKEDTAPTRMESFPLRELFQPPCLLACDSNPRIDQFVDVSTPANAEKRLQ